MRCRACLQDHKGQELDVANGDSFVYGLMLGRAMTEKMSDVIVNTLCERHRIVFEGLDSEFQRELEEAMKKMNPDLKVN